MGTYESAGRGTRKALAAAQGHLESELVEAKLEERPVDLELSGAELVAEHTGRVSEAVFTGEELSHLRDAAASGLLGEELSVRMVDEAEALGVEGWRAFYGDPLVSDEERGQ